MAADKSCSLARGNAEGHSLFCDMGNFAFKKEKDGFCTIWGGDFAFKEKKGWILHNLGLRFCI